jgi:hypothetical protein
VDAIDFSERIGSDDHDTCHGARGATADVPEEALPVARNNRTELTTA